MTFIDGFRGHDAFEAVLRAHGHPAAFAALGGLSRGGRAWRLFLEALALTCKDEAHLWANHAGHDHLTGYVDDVDISSKSPARNRLDVPPPSESQDDRLILKAMMEVDAIIDSDLSNEACKRLKGNLGRYGRPIPEKAALLSHRAAVRKELSSGNVHSSANFMLRHTSSSARKKDFAVADWSKLKERISVRDLQMYASTKGKYIEGKVLVEPITPIVGTTTILEDANGDAVPVAVYNFLPDGLHGTDADALASMKLPRGCTIRIAEPLFKIFRDGSRGIRVDDPNDVIIVETTDESESEGKALRRAKIVGDVLVQKQKRAAACEAYILGRRHAGLVSMLLSNRAQAYAKLGDWGHSLADAAASLTLQPDNKKAWYRYRKAMERLRAGMGASSMCEEERARRILKLVFISNGSDRQSKASPFGETASFLKEKGNKAFASCDYCKAAGLYTAALDVCDERPRDLLASWASCCISTENYLDALAASAASLRIQQDGMALIRLAQSLMKLGEIDICRGILNKRHQFIEDEDFFWHDREELLRCSGDIFDHIKENDYSETKPFAPPTYLPRWSADIEVYCTATRGRGIRANRDLKRGQIVLIEPPLVAASSCSNDAVFNYEGREMRKSTNEYIVQAAVNRAQYEGVLSKTMNRLDDGRNAPPSATLNELLPSLATNQVLLPSHHEYALDGRVGVSAERIEAIISNNSFGNVCFGDETLDDSFLYSALSLFNHSSSETCGWNEVAGCCVVFTSVPVRAGDELTICYHPDEEVLRRKWGIHQ